MREILLDGQEMTTREALHDALAARLALPAYYGRNLDALHDCLTDIVEETHIRLAHAQALEAQLGSYGALLIHVLEESAEENPYLLFAVIS